MNANLEDRLRDALAAEAERYQPSPDLWARVASDVAGRRHHRPRWFLPMLTAVAATAAVIVALLATADGPSKDRVVQVPPAVTPPIMTQDCGRIDVEPGTDNVVDHIKATGVECDAARTFIRRVSREHNFYSGPRTFELGGYQCIVVTDDPQLDLPTGHYSCLSGDARLTWDES